MKLLLCKFCGGIEIDSGSTSIHHMYDGITPSQYPCPFPPMVVAAQVEAEPGDPHGDLPLEVALVDEDGRDLCRLKGRVTLDPPESGFPSRSWINAKLAPPITLGAPGVLRCEVSVNGEPLGGERVHLRSPRA